MTYTFTTHNGGAKNHAIADGAVIIAHVVPQGYPLGEGWSPESEATARLLAAAPDLLYALEEAANRMHNIARAMDGDAILAASPQETLRNAAQECRELITIVKGESHD